MQVAKLSVSLPEPLLREQELESAYRESTQDADLDWELTVADGLTTR